MSGEGGRAKCGGQGGGKGPAAAWEAASRALAAADECGTAPGWFWNVRPGDLDLLRLMEPTGGGPLIAVRQWLPLYRQKALCYLQVLLSRLLWLLVRCVPCFRGGGGLFCWVCVPRTHADSFHAGQKKMDTSLGAVSIKVLFPEDIQSPGSAGLWGLLRRGSESREPVPGKRGSRGAMKPWEGAECLSDRSMDSGGGPTVLIWCSFVHGIGCLVTGVSAHWCIRYPHPVIQAPVSE